LSLSIQWLVSLLPALAGGLLALASHVPLGGEVLRRGIIFIGLAIAQFVGLGIVSPARSASR
jgi:zinc/manganese transport system permease protein